MARHYEWDDYFVPGTRVLANKLGLTDPVELRVAEYLHTDVRRREIADGVATIPQTFDTAHLQALHAHLFQDVYEWAGELRTVGIGKGGTLFAEPGPEMAAHLEAAAEVGELFDWENPRRDAFLGQTALFQSAVNLAHPFREGNGRTTKVMLTQLADRGPFALDFDRVEKIRWDIANERASNVERGAPANYLELVPVLDQIVVDRVPVTTDVTAGPSIAHLLAAARGPETATAETPDPLRYEQLPDLGQSTDVGRDQGLER